MSSEPEEGRDKCPYGPTTGYTALIVGKPFTSCQSHPELYKKKKKKEETDFSVFLQTSRCIQLPSMSLGAFQISAATLRLPH